MKKINCQSQTQGSSQIYAIMLAKILMVAMEDFAALGMEKLNLRLREDIEEIMEKYGLTPEDIRVMRPKPPH